MVSLTFYGGVDEIGGNKVLLEDGDPAFLQLLYYLFNLGFQCFKESVYLLFG